MSESHASADAFARAGDLGFTCRTRRNGDVELLRHGKLASCYAMRKRLISSAEVEAGELKDTQQLMALNASAASCRSMTICLLRRRRCW